MKVATICQQAIGMLSLLVAVQAVAAEPASPASLVQKALIHEQKGDLEKRRDLLEQALTLDSKSAQPRWHLGFASVGNEWLTPAQVADRIKADSNWVQYLQRLHTARSTAESQFRLAEWCRANGLRELARGHLLAAGRIGPEPRIHRALGRTLRDGQWLTDAEYDRSRQDRQEWKMAFKYYGPMMLKLSRQSQSNDPATQTAAIDAILAIRDPHAVPAMEVHLSAQNEKLALLVVETLPQITHWVATLSLVRHAVWAQWSSVRDAAINQLRWQDSEQIVPMLIAHLRPADSGARQIGRSHVWFWEDFSTTYIDHEGFFGWVDAVIRPGGRGGLSREDRVRRDFAVADESNRTRIANTQNALLRITGQELGSDQRDWKKWWTESTGQFVLEEEPIRTTVLRQTAREPFFLPVAAASCFAAGTPVWTMRGVVAIDKVELGDMVLSQDVTTGELAYRPVIRRTLRPRTEFRTVHVGDDALRTTAIHPFWVVGKGWMKVKDMTESPMLRAYDGPKAATVTDGEPEFAYNLEVADFHTYFVGKTGVLVHDVSPITTRGITVPGLVEAK